MDKKVSIITPCLNGEAFVARYLDSILSQTYKNIELIFVNDGSTDKTEEIVKSYISKFEVKGMKLIYIYQENAGQAAALNKGLKVFSGDYLTWPDSDDILSVDSIEKKVEFLEKNYQYGLVRTDAKVVEEIDIDKVKWYFGKNNSNKFKEELFIDFIIENKVWFAPGCYMVRVSSFIEVNTERRIYEGSGGQNWQMLLPISYKYKCGYIDEPLYTYVVRDNSHSHSTVTINQQLKRCDEHEDTLVNTIKSINMTDSERKKYLYIVKEKYVRKRFNLASEFKEKKLAKKFYNDLKNNYRVERSEFLQYISTQNRILDIGIRGIRKIKRSVAQ